MAKLPFLPREQKFFDLFEKSAENINKASKCLKDMLDKWQFVDSCVAEITEIEHEGDTITHQVISLLHRTFVTPFDREDIAELAHTLDDILDFIQSSADSMFIYKIKNPTPRARELSDVIVLAAAEVGKAVACLGHKKEFKKMLEHCVEINRLENAADRIYRAAIGELFDSTSDMAELIKWREIYENMEMATDRCEDVADVLEGVALKNA